MKRRGGPGRRPKGEQRGGGRGREEDRGSGRNRRPPGRRVEERPATRGERFPVRGERAPQVVRDDSLVYGRRPVEELLKHRPAHIRSLMVLEGAQYVANLKRVISEKGLSGISLTEVPREALDQISGGENHQGVIARVGAFQFSTLEDVIERGKVGSGVIVALDELNDPHNVGALLRVCEAAGVDGVIVTERRSAPLSDTVRRVSAGASEFVPVVQVTNLHRTLGELKQGGYWIVGTAMGERSRSLYETELPDRLVIVLGSEGRGLRSLTAEVCDFLVTIPMQGLIQSLNVSTAGSAVLFELLRRREGKLRV